MTLHDITRHELAAMVAIDLVLWGAILAILAYCW